MAFHAHELLEKIAFSEETRSLADWKQIAVEQFGADATFENCGGMQFNTDTIFDFFVSRKKISVTMDGMVTPFHENICSGPGHHH